MAERLPQATGSRVRIPSLARPRFESEMSSLGAATTKWLTYATSGRGSNPRATFARVRARPLTAYHPPVHQRTLARDTGLAMNGTTDEGVVAALGRQRFAAVTAGIQGLHKLASSEPATESWFAHAPIKLRSHDQESAEREITEILYRADPKADWIYVLAQSSDGTRIALASDQIGRRWAGTRGVVPFLFMDLHSRLNAWRLSHLWRAVDLAEVAIDSLSSWKILPAAACSRSLLEGVAACVVEARQVHDVWDRFKRNGVPSTDATLRFRSEMNALLDQAQFGTRLPIRREGSGLQRTNVLTFLKKLDDPSLSEKYEWLCDAVHPSFGFGTTFVSTQGLHRSGSTFAADIAWRSHSRPTQVGKIDPTVANAAADVLAEALDRLAPTLQELRWLVDDIGWTSEAVLARAQSPESRPGRNDPCPCGSGRKFKACLHFWGKEAHCPKPSVASSGASS